MNRIAEKTAKALIIDCLQKRQMISASTVLISEFSANRSDIRADLVLANTRSLHGIEIKTDADTLARAERQLNGYSRYFTHVTFAVSERHLARALELLPQRVGVWVIEDRQLVIKRHAKKTERRKADLIQMMNVADLKSLVRNEGLKLKSGKRDDLTCAAFCVPKNTLALAVLKSIRARYENASDDFWEAFDSADDVKQIPKLSRYFQKRELAKRQVQKLSQIWQSWDQISSAISGSLETSNQPNHHQLA